MGEVGKGGEGRSRVMEVQRSDLLRCGLAQVVLKIRGPLVLHPGVPVKRGLDHRGA